MVAGEQQARGGVRNTMCPRVWPGVAMAVRVRALRRISWSGVSHRSGASQSAVPPGSERAISPSRWVSSAAPLARSSASCGANGLAVPPDSAAMACCSPSPRDTALPNSRRSWTASV